jgi:predicted tellurium resistance membrane protein TerC
MEPRVWVNRNQPQTLYIAQVLLYFRGGIALFFGVISGGDIRVSGLVFAIGEVMAAYGIANERRWGYKLGVTVALLALVVGLLVLLRNFDQLGRVFSQSVGVLFDIALAALLLHPMSRSYQRYWPKRPKRRRG